MKCTCIKQKQCGFGQNFLFFFICTFVHTQAYMGCTHVPWVMWRSEDTVWCRSLASTLLEQDLLFKAGQGQLASPRAAEDALVSISHALQKCRECRCVPHHMQLSRRPGNSASGLTFTHLSLCPLSLTKRITDLSKHLGSHKHRGTMALFKDTQFDRLSQGWEIRWRHSLRSFLASFLFCNITSNIFEEIW